MAIIIAFVKTTAIEECKMGCTIGTSHFIDFILLLNRYFGNVSAVCGGGCEDVNTGGGIHLYVGNFVGGGDEFEAAADSTMAASSVAFPLCYNPHRDYASG